MLPKIKRHGILFTLIFIILIGGFLRFYKLNWDSFQAFHPDERNISWAVTRIQFFTAMNPKFFAYGGLPVYLYRAIGEAVIRLADDPEWLHDWGHIAVIGRYVSATLSTISLLLIYLIASSYFTASSRGRWASGPGLAAAAFLAFSPWAIQQAHFATTETMLVFFLLLLLYLSKKILAAGSEKNLSRFTFSLGTHSWKDHLKLNMDLIFFATSAAVIWGLSLAAKTTAISFGIIPISAIFLSQYKTKLQRNFVRIIIKSIILTMFFSIIAAAVFFLFSPYTILDFSHFKESMTYEGGVVSGRLPVPYTLQFTGTTSYLYQLQTMLWQGGLVTVIGILAIIIWMTQTIYRFFQRIMNHELEIKEKTIIHYSSFIILYSFPIAYFTLIGNWFTKFNRYNTLILPFLILTTAWLLTKNLPIYQLNQFTKRISFIGRIGVLVGLVGFQFIWSFMNWSIYLRPQTRIAATKWIYQNIPETAKLYTEHWNDGLPLDLPDNQLRYKRELLEVYEKPDNEQKVLYYASRLPKADYIILSTRRVWATMPYLTEQYPVTSLFYKKLLAGELGYKEVATFASYPSLFGFTINDDAAEESLQVFDHPTVRIFKNEEYLGSEELKLRLYP